MNILIADDDPVTLQLLSTQLMKWGHVVHNATNGDQAWEIIAKTPIDIVVLDWIMPGLDGPHLSRKIREHQETYIYLILISAQGSGSKAVEGLQSGVDDYIAKPIDMDLLRARIEIGSRIVKLERALTRKIAIITENHYQTIRMFSQLVEVFDEELGGHCRRTANLALELARRHPDVAEADIPTLESAALLHDIGMVGIPKAVLNKKRTEMVGGERRLYQSHPVMGASIVSEIDVLRPAARLIRMHHEQVNGKGFPDGTPGEDIPICAQLISAASIYDNLKHKGKVPLDQMPERLQRMSGYQLSPYVVNMLIKKNVAEQHEGIKKENEERTLEELEPGMVLAANIHMNTGAFVMAGDSELDEHSIEKLNHYSRIGAISNKVLIRKTASR